MKEKTRGRKIYDWRKRKDGKKERQRGGEIDRKEEKGRELERPGMKEMGRGEKDGREGRKEIGWRVWNDCWLRGGEGGAMDWEPS